MNAQTLDHIGVAVESLDDAIPVWTALTGSSAVGREEVPGQGVEVIFIGSGPGRIELLAPLRADSPIARFLERRGSGVHHLCYRVPDIGAALSEAIAAGFEAIDATPRIGSHNSRIAFLHPRSTGGVLVELLEPAKPTDMP